MQLTNEWDERYRTNTTAWEDEEVAPATKHMTHGFPGGMTDFPAFASVFRRRA